MSNFLIFKAAFNNSATPAIGTYTAEGATAQFNRNTDISPDYYLYNTARNSAVQWFAPTAEATDFEFVADILTRSWDNRITYFIIADSTGTTRLRMWSVNDNWYFENSDSTATMGSPEFIGNISPTTSGGFGVFHQFRVRVRKLTASSSSVEVYVDGTLKLTATAGAALVTCAKIGFVGGVNSFGPGTGRGVKNAYVYDLSGGDVIDRGVLSGAFNRFISWMKSKFALKSDIPTVNDATLTIQQNGTNVQTFTANQATAATANIQCVDLTSAQTIGGDKDFTGTTGTHDVIPATTDTYDLGSSAAQWNNAYIKSLTINGVACGDILTHNVSEFVNVSTAQTIGGNKEFTGLQTIRYGTKYKGNKDAYILPEFLGKYSGLSITTLGYAQTLKIGNFVLDANNKPTLDASKGYVQVATGENNNVNTCLLESRNSTSSFLGTSVNKWTSFNGINPGALSLPSISASGANAWIALDTTDWVKNAATSAAQKYTPPADGWLNIRVDNATLLGLAITGVNTNYMHQMARSETPNSLALLIPVFKNTEVAILVAGNENLVYNGATFYPCQGNV